MEKEAVIKIRESFRKATFTLTSRKDGSKKVFQPQIHVVLDNSVNIIDDGNGSLIWDDENELLWWFRGNTPGAYINSPSSGMSFGNKSEFPAMCIGSNYEQIQNIRVILNEESYFKLCNEIGSDIMSQEEIDNNYEKLFEETDMNVIISRKREINYNTGLPKKYDKTYDEDSSYTIATHPDQGGGV